MSSAHSTPVLVLAPAEGSESPEIAWGNYFFYHATRWPDPAQRAAVRDDRHEGPPRGCAVRSRPGRPLESQYPRRSGQVASSLARTRAPFGPRDFAETDVVIPHPVYGALGWIAVVNPGERSLTTVIGLLRGAHADERRRRTGRDSARAGCDEPAPDG